MKNGWPTQKDLSIFCLLTSSDLCLRLLREGVSALLKLFCSISIHLPFPRAATGSYGLRARDFKVAGGVGCCGVVQLGGS